MITYQDIVKNEEINAMIARGNQVLKTMGFTEHSKVHAAIVAQRAAEILTALGCSEHEVELAKIAGFMHDIGNSINRYDHAQSGALLAYQILKEMDMPMEDRLTIITAIGNHDEKTGTAIDPVSAALILGDKTDVRRNRVQAASQAQFDIHDRVNYAVLSSAVVYRADKQAIEMTLELDDEICSLMEYFEIFLDRMLMCQKACQVLGCKFRLVANGTKLC